MPKKSYPQYGDVYLTTLEPTRGSEMKKTRPCVVVSPNVMNVRLKTVIMAPLTSTMTPFPFRVQSHFQDQDGMIALDQMRALDKTRCFKRLGAIAEKTQSEMSKRLIEIFDHSHK